MKSKIITLLLLAATLISPTALVNAQSWALKGNTNLSDTSKIGGTSATSAQNFPLRLYTYNAERIHINANVTGKVGYVGIGTTAPATRLHVNGVITATGGTSTDWNAVNVRVPAGTSGRVPKWNGTSYVAGTIRDNGTNIGIGTLNTGFALNVAGSPTLLGINVSDGGIYSNNTAGYGLYASGSSYGVYGYSSSTYGVVGISSSSIGVYGSGDYGVSGTGTTYGVYGNSSYAGVYGTSSYIGIYGDAPSYGVYASSSGGYGVYGTSGYSTGVYGYSSNYQGGHFESSNNNALWAKTLGTASGVYAGVFEGSVYTYGTYSSSDKNLKKNIQELDDAMTIINKLKPKNYEFRNDGKYAALNLPKGNHYGLIAQELEEVLPGLVAVAPHGLGAPGLKQDVDKKPTETAMQPKAVDEIPDTKAINYTELIPIMIKAMQEQQQEIESLKTANALMQQDLQSCCLSHSANNTYNKLKQDGLDKALLEQNTPNPFNRETTIRYYVSAGNTAVIKVITLDGKEMLTIPVTVTGYGEVRVSASSIAAGTYTYTLIVDGKAVESRMMILTK